AFFVVFKSANKAMEKKNKSQKSKRGKVWQRFMLMTKCEIQAAATKPFKADGPDQPHAAFRVSPIAAPKAKSPRRPDSIATSSHISSVETVIPWPPELLVGTPFPKSGWSFQARRA